MNPSGSVLWVSTFGAPRDYNYEGYDIAIDPQSNAAIVTGQLSSASNPSGQFGNRTLTPVGTDGFVMRVRSWAAGVLASPMRPLAYSLRPAEQSRQIRQHGPVRFCTQCGRHCFFA